MKNNIIILLLLAIMASTALCMLSGCGKKDKYTPVIENKEERRLIKEGNKLFEEENYRDAEIKYKKATKENSSSSAAYYNQAVALIKQIKSADNESARNEMVDSAFSYLKCVPSMTKDSTLIAMAHHNIGNLIYEYGQFDSEIEKYQAAINNYKIALRHNPGDDDTIYNLRMAQLKLEELMKQQQQQGGGKDDKKKQDQQNQDKQNQDQQNQDKQKQDQQKQDQGKPNDNKQPSKPQDERNFQQIDKAIQDKEKEVQNKYFKAKEDKEGQRSTRNKW